jgi:hypothetical protein
MGRQSPVALDQQEGAVKTVRAEETIHQTTSELF